MPRLIQSLWSAAFLLTALLRGMPQAAAPSGGVQPPDTGHPVPSTPPPVSVYSALAKSDIVVLPVPAPNVFDSGGVCDAKGNLFAVFSLVGPPAPGQPLNFDSMKSAPIQRVSPAAKSVTSFPIQPPPDYASAERVSYNVDPQGKLYVLIRAFREPPGKAKHVLPDYAVLRYNDDGSLDTTVKLDSIPGRIFTPFRFAVFSNGWLLVSGPSRLAETGADEPIAAVFNSFGKFISELDKPLGTASSSASPAASRLPSALPSSAIAASSMTGSPDGNVYLVVPLSPTRVFAISPAGAVVSQFAISPQATGLDASDLTFASQVSVVGGTLLAITFDTSPTELSSTPRTHLVTLDRMSGAIRAVIDVASQVPASLFPACAPSIDSWYFLGSSTDQRLTLQKFFLR